MAPPLTGKSLILAGWLEIMWCRRREMGRILPNGASANTIAAVFAKGPCGALQPWGLGRQTKEATMTTKLVALVLLAALLMLAAVPAEAADVKELFAIDLADYPGKEGRMIEVSYPPGARDMVHRHDAHAFVYVLEGQIVMQLKGQPAVTLKAGQTFYEGPTDVHVVGRNASNTEPARFVVVLLKAKGAPILTPVKE
jgi:quercetin dioxygenase-like cupin family protein